MLNARRQIPYVMGDRGRTYLLAEHRWHDDELLSCLDGKLIEKVAKINVGQLFFLDITPQDVEVFFRRMFARFYVDSLMYGNLTENVGVIQARLNDGNSYWSSFLAID